MSRVALAIFVCVAFSALVNAGSAKSRTTRGEKIFVADPDGTHSKKIAEGDWPEISPDGARVAFNTEGDAKNRPGPERHIAIVDVASGKVTVATEDSERQLFRACLVAGWKTTRFFNHDRRCVAPRLGEHRWLRFSDREKCRAEARCVGALRNGRRDGKSIFCHDLDNIYRIDLDGNVLKKWELSKILTDASMNGGDRLSISPDGNTLLMDVDCGSEHERKNWDGPQPAIEKLEITADKAVRITGKDDFVWQPFW